MDANTCPICRRLVAEPGFGEGCERAMLARSGGRIAIGHVLDCERVGRLAAVVEADRYRDAWRACRDAALRLYVETEPINGGGVRRLHGDDCDHRGCWCDLAGPLADVAAALALDPTKEVPRD